MPGCVFLFLGSAGFPVSWVGGAEPRPWGDHPALLRHAALLPFLPELLTAFMDLCGRPPAHLGAGCVVEGLCRGVWSKPNDPPPSKFPGRQEGVGPVVEGE